MCIYRARAFCDIHALTQSSVRGTSAGSLLPTVCGSAVSHTLLFLRNQCMHTVAADARARARASRRSCRRVASVHAHTETESAANALTYDDLLLRKAAWCGIRRCIHVSIRVLYTRARLSQSHASSFVSMSFFEFYVIEILCDLREILRTIILFSNIYAFLVVILINTIFFFVNSIFEIVSFEMNRYCNNNTQ